MGMPELLEKTSLIPSFTHSSPLVFGGASISGEGKGYGFGDIDESEAISLLEEALDRGITVFDSAPIYGFDLSEKRMGKAFRSHRDKVLLISKSGVSWHASGRVNMTNDPQVTQKMLEQSLRDLDSDYIDLYMIHWPDKDVDIRYPLDVLVNAQAQGKIKSIGLCNTNLDDITKSQEICQLDVVQGEWNPFQQQNSELRAEVVKQKISWMSWGCLDKGILTGRVTKDRVFDASDCRSWAPWWKAIDKDSRYEKVDKLAGHLKNTEYSLLDCAVAFQKDLSAPTYPIFGMRNSQQLDSVIKSYSKDVPAQILIECLEILS